jgi:hypothetical protein
MIDELDEQLLKLEKAGADPSRARGLFGRFRRNPSETHIHQHQGFGTAHLAAAFAAGAIAVVGIGGVWMSQTGHRLASAADEKIIDAAATAGVDLSLLTVGDLRARLTLDSVTAAALAPAVGALPRDVLAWLGGHIKQVPIAERAAYVSNVATLEDAIAGDHAKYALIDGLRKLNAVEASVLADDPDGLATILKNLARLSVADRRKVAQAEFPFVPTDADRAELFAAMNDPGFPTPTIVAMWRANPERLALAMNVLAAGNAACQVKGKEAKNGERK